MTDLWGPAFMGLALAVQLYALWEMAGYFSFRPSTYESSRSEPVLVFDPDPELERAAEALAEQFEVRRRPGELWVRRRHGVTKQLLAYGRVRVDGEGYAVCAMAGPRAMLGVGSLVMPVFALGSLLGGHLALGTVVLLAGVGVYVGCRAVLAHVARTFGESVSVHL
ncbi:MAG: hypothetical protein R3F61_33985 [Myxococcota bacterium]